MEKQTYSPKKCPLCDVDNDCAMANGREAEACWCMSVPFDPNALVSIPAEAQGKICICKNCATLPTAI